MLQSTAYIDSNNIFIISYGRIKLESRGSLVRKC